MIEILRGESVPPKKSLETKYPWAELEVGDCFIVPKIKWNAVRARAVEVTRRTGMKFVTRLLPDGRVGVWRVE